MSTRQKHIFIILTMMFCLISLSKAQVPEPDTLRQSAQKSDSLVILWTSQDPEVFTKVVFVYALNSAKQGWWDHVELLIWGPSSKLLAGNDKLKEMIGQMSKNGITLTSCKWCAEQYGVVEQLEVLGVEVKYMGKPLTNYIKSERKVLVF